MDAPGTWRLLSVLLAASACCCSPSGPPAPPTNLECNRPCDQMGCSVIKCNWVQLQPHTVYTLHWKPENAENEHLGDRNSSDRFIPREDFESHGKLIVWVQAQNQNGSVRSEEIVIHTRDIIKPPPPESISSHQDPLEIHWSTNCGELQLNVGLCDIRYRTEGDQNWIQYEFELSSSYAVMEPQPNTVYEFQVRCQCDSSLKSDWSTSHKVKSAESAPVGEVDAWWDCVLPLSNFDCSLSWKNLSAAQAGGCILGYEVKVSHNNGTVQLINMSSNNPSSLVVYDKTKWRLTSSLKDVSSVSVSAYTALGATKATPLPVPISGKQATNITIYLEMNEQNLTVSWSRASKLSDTVRQYVVQYKECRPGNASEWIKVGKSQTTAFFAGSFKNYTSYQVSLFVVSDLNEMIQVATAEGYSAQGVPSTVPSFRASHIVGTDVTLFWKPVPCSNRMGVILYYQIGVNAQRDPKPISVLVYNISVTPDHGSMTYTLRDLSPGHEYEIWIRAVTAAGPGAKVTTTFKINHHDDYAIVIPVVLTVLLIIMCLAGYILCVFRGAKKVCPLLPQCLYEKVPDPSNSQIFRQMKRQINEPLTRICGPLFETCPTISVLEVIEIKNKALRPDMIKEDGCHQTDCQDDQRETPIKEKSDSTDGRDERREYSKMVDSDEEKNDSWSSSEEEQSTSGYEKHFMPSPLEVME